MANNLIQIKRSNTSVTPANTLYGGELAYSYNSNSLFIGAQTGISAASIKIGGSKYAFVDQATQGALTANAVVLVDANAFISNTFTSGLFIGSSIASPAANATAALITSITPQANSTQLGATVGGSNTELVTSFAIKTYVDGKIAAQGVNTAAAYTWSNIHTFNANVSLTGNATNQLIIGTTTINATTYSGTANNATNFGGLSLATVQGQITGNAATAYTNAVAVAAADATTKAGTAYTNAVAFANAAVSNGAWVAANATYAANSGALGGVTLATIQGQITGNAATAYTNAVAAAAADATTKAGTAYTNATVFASNASNINTGTLAVARLPANVVFWSNNNTFTGTQSFNDVTVSGNLVVQGTVTSINTTSLQVKDNFIEVAEGNQAVAADAVDFGVYGTANSGAVTTYYGFARIATANAFKVFSTTLDPTGTTVGTNTTMPLQAYLQPWGNGGAFVVNSSAVALTANASVSVNITANSITLGTPLAATSGGTGQSSYTAGDMLYASGTTALAKVAIGTFGTVLQANSSGLPQFATLDGGTF